MSESALVVIDMQNDFCPGGSLAVNEGNVIVSGVNELIHKYPLVVATQDWHPAGHVSFASSHDGCSAGDVINIDGIDQYLWPDHCVQGSYGSDFHPQIDSDRFHMIIRKGWHSGLDSYSAFFENDNKTSTGLDGWLKSMGVKKLSFCGLATDYCVFFSIRDAVSLGYETKLYTEASRGVDLPPGNLTASLETLKELGTELF